MKIEKINDNQIRCTLTSDDLAKRQIRISELAYGTEKAKNLFRDMMQQAHHQFGFDADNIPLMIEAIPASPDSIVLIITKVEDPEELDTRFSKFAPTPESVSNAFDELHFEGADDIIDIFKKIYEAKAKALAKKKAAEASTDEALGNKTLANDADQTAKNGESEPVPVDLVRLYEFPHLDAVIEAAISLNHFYTGVNSLYKDEKHSAYLLVLHQSNHTPEEFNKVCNVLSEYAGGQTYSAASEAYLQEHKDIVIAKNAVQQLSELK